MYLEDKIKQLTVSKETGMTKREKRVKRREESQKGEKRVKGREESQRERRESKGRKDRKRKVNTSTSGAAMPRGLFDESDDYDAGKPEISVPSETRHS